MELGTMLIVLMEFTFDIPELYSRPNKLLTITYNYHLTNHLRECPQNNFAHILRYFNYFPLVPFT